MQRQGLAAPVRAGTQPAPALASAAARAEWAAAMPPRSGLADLLARSPRGLAQGAVVSSLQAGPRALAQRRQMATSVPARVTQRYTVVEAGQQRPNYWQGLGAALRVADDGKMALKHVDGGPKDAPDYQHFYVTADIIQGSQQALTVTGSAFSIAQGGGTLVGSAPGKQISAQYGIDESALPEVGQGFGIIRGGQGGQGGREGMGHFAPVVAVSGQDRVTLENDVNQTADREKQAVGEINPNWYSRMFGSVKKRWYGNQDQTFWGEAKKHEKAEYGDRPLVASLGSRPRED